LIVKIKIKLDEILNTYVRVVEHCSSLCVGAVYIVHIMYVSALLVVKVLPCPTPKYKNAQYLTSAMSTNLHTSLLPRKAMFIQLLSCRQEQEC
jgi:hypothetical protein